MAKNLKFDFHHLLDQYLQEGFISLKEQNILEAFFSSYQNVVFKKSQDYDPSLIIKTYLERLKELRQHPFEFEPYHKCIRKPFDYYAFGVEFLRPLIDPDRSALFGEENIKTLSSQLNRGENAILFANHQIEADPQAISLLLENCFPKLAEEMIFVAGERVTTDILAIPFSMGRNLLCIYSKKYIDNPPHFKEKKLLHNKKTMQLMSQLLSEGGKCIYVAPSGGRDRPDEKGNVYPAPFDSQSIEMFYLMAKKSKKPTHFYPLALKTYKLLPPPATIQIELGEKRITSGGPIYLSLEREIAMDDIPGYREGSKDYQRKIRADYIHHLVKEAYGRFL